MVGYQLAAASQHLEAPDNNAVRLAGLGLPLVFLAFLNLVVWTQESPRRSTRMFAHAANGLMLIASGLVGYSVGVIFAYVVGTFTLVLTLVAISLEIHFRNLRGGNPISGTDGRS